MPHSFVRVLRGILQRVIVGLALAPAALAHAQPEGPPVPGSQPELMRAIRVHAFGGPEVLRLEDVERPTPGEGELLVRVRAAGVNPVDWKIRSGSFGSELPLTPGYDISGEVAAVGEGVESFAVGDEVFAYLSLDRGGGYAEYAIVQEGEAALKPKRLPHMQAAGVPLAALTAWQALVDKADLQPGQTVLIHAGAGGVGHFAVQIAKARGATVIATASERNHELLYELGADVVIDYRTRRFEEVATEVDVVLDSIGGETQERSFQTLKKGGILVSIVQPPSQEQLDAHGVRGTVFLVEPSGAQLATLAQLIEEGKLKPHIGATFPLRSAHRAHALSETGHARGKIVLLVN
ncbi:MAG: NADP-dependent oxidoreductase [Phycisphaerales bacterium]